MVAHSHLQHQKPGNQQQQRRVSPGEEVPAVMPPGSAAAAAGRSSPVPRSTDLVNPQEVPGQQQQQLQHEGTPASSGQMPPAVHFPQPVHHQQQPDFYLHLQQQQAGNHHLQAPAQQVLQSSPQIDVTSNNHDNFCNGTGSGSQNNIQRMCPVSAPTQQLSVDQVQQQPRLKQDGQGNSSGQAHGSHLAHLQQQAREGLLQQQHIHEQQLQTKMTFQQLIQQQMMQPLTQQLLSGDVAVDASLAVLQQMQVHNPQLPLLMPSASSQLPVGSPLNTCSWSQHNQQLLEGVGRSGSLVSPPRHFLISLHCCTVFLTA